MLPFGFSCACATPTAGSAPGTAVSAAPIVTPMPARKSRRFTSAMCPSVGGERLVTGSRTLQGGLAVTRWSDQCQATTIMVAVLAGFPSAVGAAARAIARAVRARAGVVALVAAAVIALDVLLPPLLLSVVRAPWTYFTFNPWLKSLPSYLASPKPWPEKLDFLSRVALFWFSADGPYGAPEWGFAVDAGDVLRFVVTALLIGVYVAVWLDARDVRTAGWAAHAGRTGGTVGACVSVLGLSTGPCSVVGCGAPVLPVVGLVFAGLSSTTLAVLSQVSRVSAIAVIVVLLAAIGWLGWQTRRV